ncbi:MAG: hypothetical protein HY314_00360 [Acidobacteria bacterium]|nr:hypothetical protein [Acidobacteriota bacterium]
MNNLKKESVSLQPIELSEADARLTEEPYRRWWIWLVYVLLFAASIPWYLPKGSTPMIWLGLPHWVVISLIATIGMALFTAFSVNRFWREAEPPTSPMNEEDQRL